MKIKKIFGLLLSVVFISCDSDLKDMGSSESTSKGEFVVSQYTKYSVSLMRSASIPLECTAVGNMDVNISEGEWEGTNIIQSRSSEPSVNGDDTQWYDGPFISLYVTDVSDNLKISNVPYNGNTRKVYTWYQRMSNAEPIIDGEQECTTAAFIWDSWSKKEYMPESANFYGYYPRPTDCPSGDNLHHTPLSIVNLQDAKNTASTSWHELKYVLVGQQTDENMFQHDLMYSIPETEEGAGNHRWGNKGKTQTDNIQMHFTHAFSLLNITINKGTHQQNSTGSSRVDYVELRGNKIYNTGTLDMKAGKTIPNEIPGSIERTIAEENKELTDEKPFKTNVLIQPCTVSEADDFKFLCKVDGITYQCDITGITFEANKVYDLNMTLKPDGLAVFKLWEGATVTLSDGDSFNDNEKTITVNEHKTAFTVSAASGYTIRRVVKNGKVLEATSGSTYALNIPEGSNDYYNVVVTPDISGTENGWYITDDLRMHFDGIKNNMYHSTQQAGQTTWYDLSGMDNHGALKFVDNDGWDGVGLEFEKTTDIVTFSGGINPTAYTISIILYTKPGSEQEQSHYRLIAEGDRENPSYPSFYIQTYNPDTSGSGELALYCHGLDEPMGVEGTGGAPWQPLGKTKQFDFVYENVNGSRKLDCYINGALQTAVNEKLDGRLKFDAVPAEIASIGNRVSFERPLKGTYYGVLIYDKALNSEEISKNWSVTSTRYSGLNFGL